MSRLVDLTGKVFGQLTVIERVKIEGENESHWLCQCTCGNKKVVLAGNLKSGNTTSCGCTAIEKTSAAKFIDLTNQRFGKLTVLYVAKREPKKQTLWRCKCDCGNECDVSIENLRSGHTQSCGCLRNDINTTNFTKDVTGQVFGYLTVVERAYIDRYGVFWKCKCKCGSECIVRSTSLFNMQTTSCGCRNVSFGEEKIKQILDNENINYLYNKGYFKDLLGNSNQPLRYDFILFDDNNLPYRIIEFDGTQHDSPQDIFGGEEKFLIQKANDIKKNEYAKSHNIPLIRIPYKERKNISKEMIFGDNFLI